MIILSVVVLLLIGVGGFLYAPDKPRAGLEAIYAGPPSRFVEAAGLRLHVRDTGPRDAPAVIMLHGFGASLHTWEGWAGPLSARWRVIRFDLPGFGLTGADPTGDYTDRRAEAVLLALMDRLAVHRTTLIGNSMGGRIAWRFAADHPDRVDRLVLVSPDGFASPGIAYGQVPEVPPMMRLLPYVLPTALVRMTIAPAYADPARLTDETVRRYRDMLLAPGVREAILARTTQDVLDDPVPLLRRIQAPTLLLWGEQDGMIPIANAEDYLAVLPHASLTRLPGLGHVAQEEAPTVSLPCVQSFLAE